jgi:hypothetical protein
MTTRNVKLHRGPNSPKVPYIKGEIRFGSCKDESFKLKGPLDKNLKIIVKKYGILPEQLYSVSIVAMATVVLGLSVWSSICITMMV